MTVSLDGAETARWTAWKQANDAVMAEVARQIQAASGLSGADFAILSRVIEDGGGEMSQQELGAMLGWQRPRLSRQLSRMADRGLVSGEAVDGRRRVITATGEGRDALDAARPAHARAVRQALLTHAATPQGDAFWSIVRDIAATRKT